MKQVSELCIEKYEHIKEVLVEHESRLNWHEDRIINLEKDGREYKTNTGGLIKKMDDFIITIKWELGIFVTVLS